MYASSNSPSGSEDIQSMSEGRLLQQRTKQQSSINNNAVKVEALSHKQSFGACRDDTARPASEQKPTKSSVEG